MTAAASWLPDGDLRLEYRFTGNPAALRVPAPAPVAAADGLWQHTCCEAFVAAVDAVDYREFNLSPSTRWAAYRFAGYRQRDADWPVPGAPHIEFTPLDDGWRLVARVPAALLPEARQLAVSLTAVLESASGDLSYWALTHAGARPDFHLRSSFVLPLNRP